MCSSDLLVERPAGRRDRLQLSGLRGRDVRGAGLMIGVELDFPCGHLVAEGMKEGMLFNVTHGSVIRLLPPLVMSEDEGRVVVERLAPLVRAHLAQPQPRAAAGR